MYRTATLFIALTPCIVIAAPPANDPAVDWLMQTATTAPTTRPLSIVPATRPVLSTGDAEDAPRDATLTLSDGRVLTGPLTTTPERPVRVWVEDDKTYHDLPLAMIRSIEAKVLWERDEKQWTFKATGSDEKIYSGKTYPARETAYTFTLDDGSAVTGAVVAPLYLRQPDGRDATFVLHKRDKGDIGQTIDQLVYVKTVTFKK